ncbi:hypothetical protein QBC43DRAFT_319386 [Cladorrhinum sp. PSN259]|nr:hypothetical protein QBC43DRAFT_319386 [Cladorrhinum sp. PSN259]
MVLLLRQIHTAVFEIITMTGRILLHRNGLTGLVIATGLSSLSIITTTTTAGWGEQGRRWITLTIPITPTENVHGYSSISDYFGLYQRCTTTTTTTTTQQCTTSSTRRCVPFPEELNCPEEGNDAGLPSFCSMWRTARLILGLVVPLLQLCTLVAFIYFKTSTSTSTGRSMGRTTSVVPSDGSARSSPSSNSNGKKKMFMIPAAMLVLTGCAQGLGVVIIDYLFDHDPLFLVPGYQLGLSWYLGLLSAGVMFLTAFGMVIRASVLSPENEDVMVQVSEKSGV